LIRGRGQVKERRYQRATCSLPAEFGWGTITHPAALKILGLGGAFLATSVMVPVDEEVQLSFEFESGSEPVHCRARVAWLAERGIQVRGRERERGFAVEFLRILPEDRGRIDDYIRKRLRLFKAIEHELNKSRPDKALVKDLFLRLWPGESTHLNHIKKACRDERRQFRLLK